MKPGFLLLFVLITPLLVTSQNIPACDSLVIDCCSFNTLTPNTVSIEVSNYSSNIFSYPGFVLFDANMDTVAIETVNYYGIGWDQIFNLNIINPIILPFEGTLELHTLFYDSLVCTFPLTIPDTTLTLIQKNDFANISIFPNPVVENLTISYENLELISNIQISGSNGRLIKEINNPVSNTIIVDELKSGIYFILINEKSGSVYRTKFIKK